MRHPDDDTRTATMGEAHAEWHLNSGIPMGTPGCPQDACHPVEDFDPDDEGPVAGAVRCGNRRVHGGEVHYHQGVEGVRRCYAEGNLSEADAAAIRADSIAEDRAEARAEARWEARAARADITGQW